MSVESIYNGGWPTLTWHATFSRCSGKSFFGLYMLQQLLTDAMAEPRTIVWLSAPQNTCVFFRMASGAVIDKPEVMSLKRGRTYLDDNLSIVQSKANWIIYDGVRPAHAVSACNCLLISSPRASESVFSNWIKGKGFTCYMPVWSDDEMLHAQQHIFNIASEHYTGFRDLFGNIPRHVFEEGERYEGDLPTDLATQSEETVDEKLLQLASVSQLATTYAAVSRGQASDFSHYLLHIDVPVEDTLTRYKKCFVKFASPRVESLLMDRLEKSEAERQALWVAVSRNSRENGSLRGLLYQRYAHRYICDGKSHTFPIRRLLDDDTESPQQSERDSTVSIQVATSRCWKTIDEAQHWADHTYGMPQASHHKAIDSLLQPDSMFQMTVSERHDVLRTGVKDAADVLTTKGEKRLYFVVPGNVYDKWRQAQIYTKSDGNEAKRRLNGVSQYALKLDVQLLRSTVMRPPSDEETEQPATITAPVRRQLHRGAKRQRTD